MRRIPYLIVIGDNEVENNELSIRTRAGKDLGVMKVDKFIKMVDTLVCDKSILLDN
jgi:threonyl-tRNA synthetase